MTQAWSGAPPVLIVHGESDTVVPFSQATSLAKALEAANAPYLLVKVPGAGHGWGLSFNSAASLRTLPVIVDFLARALSDQRPLSEVKAPTAASSSRRTDGERTVSMN